MEEKEIEEILKKADELKAMRSIVGNIGSKLSDIIGDLLILIDDNARKDRHDGI